MARDYNIEARRRRRMKKRMRSYARAAVCFACILVVSLVITLIIDGGKGIFSSKSEEEETVSSSSGSVLAPLPMQGSSAAMADSFGPVLQTENYSVEAYDAQNIRLKSRGQVSLDYFADAAFLGDSLTEGFTEYSINLSGALICGYVGIGPDAVVNRSSVTHPERGQEVALDVLQQAMPKKLYVLLGTNTLVTTGTEDKFLAYYGQMLDDLRETLGDDCKIYVQSIPPVQASVKDSKPGLDNTRLAEINESLAKLADEKGCYYVDLWEAFADSDGNLNASYAAADGIHFTAGKGYTAWVNYLRSHTAYSADNDWTPGTAFAS